MQASIAIEHIPEPDERVYRAIFDLLERFNDHASGRSERERWFGAFLGGADGVPLGGAVCVSYWGWTFVDMLHLPELLRGQGGGTRVMRAVETEALRRGCHGVWLDTSTYQAPGFYRKLGFSEFSRLPMAPGVERLSFLKTRLSAWPDQGVRIVADPPAEQRAAIRDDLRAYNDSRAGPGVRQLVALAVRGEPGGAIAGGVWGRIMRSWLQIELVFLPEELRGRGVGSRMMAQAEGIARAAGCRGVVLDSFSFQAPGFYRRLGYTQIGAVPDYPPPHARLLFAKRLDSAPVLQEEAAEQAAGRT